ncbi:ankyrin repeat-containing domain protein [Cercophora samala]|uniref:Ankyrin repeat-containing domain protein n=1 Tax=Cercophora samala TaxID=330535 RepID=A0AA40DB70_9PEZI|nr:ankyrin repeat-containing domain protein [Cercophora samala]
MAALSRDKIPATGLTVIHEPEGEANLDVVFVHGFRGHPVRTWTHKHGSARPDDSAEPASKARKLGLFSRPHDQKTVPVYWPEDLLPAQLPGARVLTFGYDTNLKHKLVGSVLNESTIYDMAGDFLTALEAIRRLDASRPLLFIAHSLGGIMVKEALRQAHGCRHRHLQLKKIFDSTMGIFFFGTPHRGADPRGLVVSLVEKIVKGVGIEANQHVLNTLHPNSECRQLRDEFESVLRDQDWIIYSFQEGLGLWGLGQKVVENNSSYLDFPDTERRVQIGKDHREMCRFSSPNDTDYQKVAAALDRIAEKVSVSQSTSDVGFPAPSPDEQTPPEATSLSDQDIQTLLDSLKFDQIDSRQESIRMAHKNTCAWITKTREYKDWLDINKMKDHHGFLWMRGKAGSGKSTLIKSTLRSFQRAKSSKGTTVIHFFFNARGAELEKTTRGMYRALLVQLLETLQTKMPHFQKTVFESAAIETWSVREGREWSVAILEELFENAILSIGQEEVTCFIDALDECDDDQVEPMIRLFERIGEQAISRGLRVRIFFSSRHYPDISLDTCLNLLLDGQDGHVRDIKTYIQNELKVGDQQTKDKLLGRSSGIFMWAVLVVDIMNKENRRGTPSYIVDKKLEDIPGDLWELFKSILTRDKEDKDHLLLCIQWLLFTRTPLEPEQFYYALLSGLGSDDNLDSDHGWHSSPEPDADSDSREGSHLNNEPTEMTEDAVTARLLAVHRFIRNRSKGLAEVTQSKKAPVVQFIHESVRDFLLKEEKKGLRVIWPELGDDFEAQSHERLKRCCFQYYMRREIFTNLGVDFNIELPKASSEEGNALRAKATETFPFLGYATENVLWHAERAQTAEDGAVSQMGFLEDDFDLRPWLLLRNVLKVHEAHRYNSTYTAGLLYVLAELNLPALVKISLPRFSAAASLATEQERYGSPVLVALVFRSRGVIDVFVDHLAALQQIPTSDVEVWRSETGTVSKLSTDFRFSEKRSLFSYVTEFGDMALVQLLCRMLGRNEIDRHDKDGKTPLMYAAREGHGTVFEAPSQQAANPDIPHGNTDTVKLLFQKGVNIEASPTFGTTPVSWAAEAECVDIVKFVCGKGTDINKPDGRKRGPISYACERGHTAILDCFLQAGLDFVAGDVVYATKGTHADCLRLLIHKGADVHARDGSGTTLLMHAVRNGNLKAVELLLEKGVSTKTVDRYGKSAMHYANSDRESLPLARFINLVCSNNPHWTDDGGTIVLHYAVQQQDAETLQTLLNMEAVDINLRDQKGRTPLSYASESYKGHDAMELLLRTGKADVDSKDNDGRTPLSYAVTEYGNQDKVKLLLNTGKVDVNSKDNHGRTPLSHAVTQINSQDTVKLLLDTGKVDVNSKDNDGRTPLSWAIGDGCASCVYALLSVDTVEVNSRDLQGRTPLVYALESLLLKGCRWTTTSMKIIAALLETGRVNVDLKDNAGRTAFDIAAAVDEKALVQDDFEEKGWWRAGENRIVSILKEYKEGKFRGLPDLDLLLW